MATTMKTTADSPRQTLDQRRAAHAWSVIEWLRQARDGKGNPKYLKPAADRTGDPVANEAGRKLGTQMKKLPTRIMAAGLGQALTFLYAKHEAPPLEQALTDWLLHDRPEQFDPQRVPENDGCTRLIEQLINQWTAATLRQQTEEALAYLPWLARFAKAAGLMDTEHQTSRETRHD